MSAESSFHTGDRHRRVSQQQDDEVREISEVSMYRSWYSEEFIAVSAAFRSPRRTVPAITASELLLGLCADWFGVS